MTTSYVGQTVSEFSAIMVNTEYVDLSTSYTSIDSQITLTTTSDSASDQVGISALVQVGVHAYNLTGKLAALSGWVQHNGSGTVDLAVALDLLIRNGSSGTITSAYGARVQAPGVASGAMTHFYGFHAEEITVGTNPHYLWFDSDGVLDIREASSQAIIGLHNPGITKFTSGSADYERSVLQWASNILQLGAEKGGTGTLRKVRLLGAGLILDTDILPSSDPGVPGQVYRTAGALMVSL